MKATLLGFALVLLSIPASALAQASADKQDARWAQWLGCWELVTEDVRAGARAIPRQQLLEGQPRICIAPAPDGGATFETTVAGQSAITYTMVPNGTERPLAETACRGAQRSEWSDDGLRIYGRAELTCTDDNAPRRVSTLSLIAPNGQWVDLQAVTIAGRENVRVRRYRRAGQGTASFRSAPGSPLSLDDVKDASGKVSSLALEAALIETNAGYDLTARRLAELDAAGVSDNVIDLIVALSYPEKFVVERTSRWTASNYSSDPFALGWAFGHPVWYDDFYYSPYAYSRIGGINGSYYGNGGLLYVPVDVASPGPQPSGAGRVVDGMGYTRVRPRDSEPAVNTGTRSSTGDIASGSAPSGGGSSSSSSSSGSSGGSSGGGSSTGGSSSGGDSGGGRTAVPR